MASSSSAGPGPPGDDPSQCPGPGPDGQPPSTRVSLPAPSPGASLSTTSASAENRGKLIPACTNLNFSPPPASLSVSSASAENRGTLIPACTNLTPSASPISSSRHGLLDGRSTGAAKVSLPPASTAIAGTQMPVVASLNPAAPAFTIGTGAQPRAVQKSLTLTDLAQRFGPSGERSKQKSQNTGKPLVAPSTTTIPEVKLTADELADELAKGMSRLLDEDEGGDDDKTIKTYRLAQFENDRSIQPWFFKEQRAAQLYPEFLESDSKQSFPMTDIWDGRNAYRAADWPKLRTGIADSGRLRFTTFMEISADVRDADGQSHAVTTGCGVPVKPKKRREGTDPRTTRLRFRPDTQHPSLQVDINIPGIEYEITCDIYATDMAKMTDNILFDARAVGHDDVPFSAVPDVAACKALYHSKELLLVKLSIADGAILRITGTTERILEAALRNSEDSPECQVIRLLQDRTATGRTITFATSYLNKDFPFLGSFFQIFTTLCFTAAVHGNYWWYRLSANMTLDHEAFPFHIIPFPRWLGSQFEVKYDTDGNPVETTAVQCTPFMALGQSRLPAERTPWEALAFEHRLGNARDMANQFERCQRYTKALSHTTAVFETVRNGAYIAFVTVHDGDGNTEEDEDAIEVEVLPEVGTPIKMGIVVADNHFELRGAVVDDPTRKENVSFVLAVTSIDSRFANAIRNTTGAQRVALRFIASTESYTRARDALSSLWRIPESGEGIDVANLLLCRPTARTTSWLRVNLSPDSVWSTYTRHVSKFGLNESQVSATEDMVRSPGGVHVLIGPAGTGKTTTLIALATSLLAAMPDLKLMITAPNNEALDNVMRKFEALGDDKLPEGFDRLSIVRFTSAFVSAQKLPSRTDTDGDVAMDDDAPDARHGVRGATSTEYLAADADVAQAHDAYVYQQMFRSAQFRKAAPRIEHSFAHKKLQWTRNIATSCTDRTLQKTAVDFLNMLEAAEIARMGNGKYLTSRERIALRHADDELTCAFLKHKVRIMICTNSSSAHPIVDQYKPKAMIMEEAGLAHVADAAVPLMTHKDLQFVALFGDHNQLRPVLVNRNGNEAVERMRMSILEQCHEDSAARFPRSQLRVQYRMQASLSVYPRMKGYAGQVDDAPSCVPVTPVQQLVLDHTTQLQGLTRGRCRFAIDCPGVSARRKVHDSPFNALECQRAVEVAQMMLCDGKVSPKDIVIMSPYSGQVREIKHALHAQTSTPALGQIGVRTTYGMQGSEAEIIILSLVSNVAKKPHRTGFIIDQNLMLVALTRAKSVLVVLGNFAAWHGVTLGQMQKVEGTKVEKSGPLNRQPATFFREFVWDLAMNKDIISDYDWDQVVTHKKTVDRPSYKPLTMGPADKKAPRLPAGQPNPLLPPARSLPQPGPSKKTKWQN